MSFRTTAGVLASTATAAVIVGLSVGGGSVDQSLRQLPEVRHAMDAYRKEHPACEVWAGHGKGEVHHECPLWMFVDQPREIQIANAANTNRMISLCRKCHEFAHVRNFGQRAITNIRELVRQAVIVERGTK